MLRDVLRFALRNGGTPFVSIAGTPAIPKFSVVSWGTGVKVYTYSTCAMVYILTEVIQ